MSRSPEAAAPRRDETGMALAGTLLAMMLLAGLAAVILSVSQSSGRSPSGESPTRTPTTLPVAHPSAAISATAVAACRTNYTAVQEAVAEYETETGTGPTNISQLHSLLREAVVTSQYTISIDRSLAGEIDVATPSHRPSPGEANCDYAGQ